MGQDHADVMRGFGVFFHWSDPVAPSDFDMPFFGCESVSS
jgi:hypothetical protein